MPTGNAGEPSHWPTTRFKLENTALWRREFNETNDRGHWNHRLIGLAAKRAIKNAFEAILSADHDKGKVSHLPIDKIWRYYAAGHLDLDNGETQDTQLNDAMLRLLEHTSYDDPYGEQINWLDQYDKDHPYRHLQDTAVRAKLGQLLNETIDLLNTRVHTISRTSPKDLFQGQPPWETKRENDDWHKVPGWIKIRLEPSQVKRIPHFPEALIIKEIGGETYGALVPVHTIADNDSWIPARRIRTVNGKVEFHLPTGNDGRPVWRIPQEYAEAILIQ